MRKTREDAKKPQKNLQKSQKSACIYAPLLVKSHLCHFIKPKTAIAPVFIRGVAVFVFALICTIFEIVLFFLLRFFDDCPHICLRDEFIIRSETEGCVQGIC